MKMLAIVKILSGIFIFGLISVALFVENYIILILGAMYFIAVVVLSDGLNMLRNDPLEQKRPTTRPQFNSLKNVNIVSEPEPEPEPEMTDKELFEQWKKGLEKPKNPKVEPPDQDWVCKECGKLFKNEKMMRRHYGMAHYDLIEM